MTGGAGPVHEPTRSPNIWASPYEVENLGVDREGHRGRHGAPPPPSREPTSSTSAAGAASTCRGGGPLGASSVVGVEPYPPLLDLARVARGRGRRPSRLSAGADRAGPAAAGRLDGHRARPVGPISSAPAASRGLPSWPGSCARAARRSSSTTTPPAPPSAGGSSGPTRATTPLAVERFWARQGWSRERLVIRWALRHPRGLRGGRPDRVPGDRRRGHPPPEHEGTGVDYFP